MVQLVAHHALTVKIEKGSNPRPGTKIRELLARGFSAKVITDVTGCSFPTVWYHAQVLGLPTKRKAVYDWREIQRFHDQGFCMSECRAKFGFSKMAWDKARKRGVLKPHDHRIPMSSLLVENCKKSRGHIKGRLVRGGFLGDRCAICGMGAEWMGKTLVLRLDHVNGVNDDYRIENLRLVCPNCDSQLPTFAGRNVRKRIPDGVIVNALDFGSRDSRLES